MILGVEGQPLVRLGDDARIWMKRIHGDVVCEYQWHDGDSCMVLYRLVPEVKTGAFVIDMQDAHKYATNEGKPTMQLVQDSVQGALSIGLSGKDSARKVADIIMDGIHELVKMPPAPDHLLPANPLSQVISATVDGEQVYGR